jgi:hypothetical protein
MPTGPPFPLLTFPELPPFQVPPPRMPPSPPAQKKQTIYFNRKGFDIAAIEIAPPKLSSTFF